MKNKNFKVASRILETDSFKVIAVAGADIKLDNILFRQLDRIGILSTHIKEGFAESYIFAVDTLEGFLQGYVDENEEYDEKKKAIQKWYKKVLEDKANRSGRIESDLKQIIDYEKARRKFKALMKMIYGIGMITMDKGQFISKM